MQRVGTMSRARVASVSGEHSLALIGLNFSARPDEAQVYLFLRYGEEEDYPIMKDGKILLFQSVLAARKWLEKDSGMSAKWEKVSNNDGSFICSIAGALHLIESCDIDRSATIINCLNTFSDLLPATGFQLPTRYKRELIKLADHLTFHREYGAFLQQKHIARSLLRDAILWSVGAVVVKSEFMNKPCPQYRSRR